MTKSDLNFWLSPRCKGPQPRAHDNHLYSNISDSTSHSDSNSRSLAAELRVWYIDPLPEIQCSTSILAITPNGRDVDYDGRTAAGRDVESICKAAESFGWNIEYIDSRSKLSAVRKRLAE